MYRDAQFRILLVEDNPGDVRLVEIFLGESDLKDNEIVNEKTLVGAIKALDERLFDVVLLDFNLLDSNGFETLERLLAAHPKANVIVFTGMEDTNFGIRALQAGAQDYLVKGNFGSDYLAKTLRYAIERNRTNLRLEEARARYKLIFDQSQDAIYITKESGEFVEFNQATQELFGYTEEEIRNIDVSSLYADENQRQVITGELREKSFVKNHRLDIRKKNGDVRHCNVTANLVHTDAGEIEYHGIIRDITEELEAAKLREEKEKEQLKGQLLTMVSHEMRTPMNAIMGLVDLLPRENLIAEQIGYLDSVKSQSEHLLKMINDILELQKIEFNIKLENGTFDLHDLLINLINIQYSAAKDVAINIKIDENVPRFVAGDEKRLNQVLINIVSNAFKFTEKGEVCIRVVMIASNEEGTVRLSFKVEDTGIGIPEDKLLTIFDPFVRVRDGQKKFYEGIGLGLSIVQRIINLMDGNISVTSELGVGSTFSFDVLLEHGDEESGYKLNPTFEAAPEVNGSHSTESNNEVETIITTLDSSNNLLTDNNGGKVAADTEDGTDRIKKISILLAEDNEMNQLVTQKQLERTGRFEVTIVENGLLATEILRENEFELVLMDIQMPIMEGDEATKYIRNELKISSEELPILAMTAHADVVDEIEKYKTIGIQDCIIKPVHDWPAAIAKIDTYLQKKIKRSKNKMQVKVGLPV